MMSEFLDIFNGEGVGVRSNVRNTQILRRSLGDVNSVSWGEWHDFEIICNLPTQFAYRYAKLPEYICYIGHKPCAADSSNLFILI